MNRNQLMRSCAVYIPGYYNERTLANAPAQRESPARQREAPVCRGLKSFVSDLEYKIIQRIRFKKNPCQRFSDFRISKTMRDYLERTLGLSCRFKDCSDFLRGQNIITKNYVTKTSYFYIREGTFEMRFVRKRLIRVKDSNLQLVEKVAGHTLAVKFCVGSAIDLAAFDLISDEEWFF